MKNKLAILALGVVTVFLFVFLYLSWGVNTYNQKYRHSRMRQMRQQELNIFDKSNGIKDEDKHGETLKKIDRAWENIRGGDQYFKSGDYLGAVKEYEKAYSIGAGSQAVSGSLLVESYEKLGRYDDALNLIDEMILNNRLSSSGLKEIGEIKDRLLIAKSQAAQSAQTQ